MESNIKLQQKGDKELEAEEVENVSVEREHAVNAAVIEAEPINIESVANPKQEDDLKTVVTLATGISHKSTLLINKLVDELEEEKRARQELQREI